MPNLNEISKSLSKFEDLERKLHLKELQIKGLLAITQAINENVSSAGLFRMYCKFLEFEMAVPRMVLFFHEDGKWSPKAQHGVQVDFSTIDLDVELQNIKKTSRLDIHSLPAFSEFDIVVPVFHKQDPLAFTFIGGFGDKDDIYDKVHFITTITNVIAVAIENKRLFNKQVQQELIGRELEMASSIQRTLVPTKLPNSTYYKLASIYKPHFAVGGDYFDVVEFKDGRMAFCIADVTGKGMSAALLMANFQASLHSLLHRGLNLEDIVREINASVFKVTGGDRFVTLFLGKYDPAERSLHYINAGHPPPLIVSEGEIIKLENGCTPVGWMPNIGPIEIGGLCLTGKQGLLLSYTDGINDIQNRKGDYFEEHLLEAFMVENENRAPEVLNEELLHCLDAFRGSEPFPDDITVLTAQFS